MKEEDGIYRRGRVQVPFDFEDNYNNSTALGTMICGSKPYIGTKKKVLANIINDMRGIPPKKKKRYERDSLSTPLLILHFHSCDVKW